MARNGLNPATSSSTKEKVQINRQLQPATKRQQKGKTPGWRGSPPRSRPAALDTGTDLPITAIVAVAIAVAVSWVVLLMSRRLGEGKKGLVKQLLPKLLVFLVLSMGLQFGLSGLKSFMAG